MEYLIILLANNAFFIMFGVIIGIWLENREKKTIKNVKKPIKKEKKLIKKNNISFPKNEDEIKLPKNIGEW